MENTNTTTPRENASASSVFRPTFASNLYRLLSSALRQVFLQVVKSIFRFQTTPLLYPSTCPQSASYPDYDVFISHRGPDVKAIFATELYRCLVACGFQVFLDEPEMRVGDHFPCQIKHAIETASIHIAIFSPTYAQSRWCLEELQHMWMVCESRQASIVPVFYEVEPAVVRGALKGQTGAYAKALSEHEEKRSANFETIKKWRKALFDVANISGLELKKCNGGKDELLANVVEYVLNIREKSRLKYVLKENFGSTVCALLHRRPQQGLLHRIYSRVKVRRTMRSGKPKFMGIVGAAGMGMTKLAKEFKEKNKSRYSGSCLLSDVKESSPVSLLRKLLEDLTRSNEQIDTIEQGIHKLKEHILTCKASKFLIILDDVDDHAQMKALSPIWDVLSPNSFILVTSRYRDVLIGGGIKEASIYDLRSGSRTNLILAGDWLVELPPCLNQVKNLKELWLRDSPNLERLSTRFFQLRTRSGSFHQPNRSGSYQLLNRLTELTITDCGIIFLSQELKDMNDLRVLRVCNCPLDELSFRKAEVELISQRKARLLGPAGTSESPCAQGVCPKLQHLWIYSCRHLVKVGSMPKTLKTVDFSYCSALREIEGLPYLAGLEQLDISGCEEVEELPSLQRLKSLKSLKASKCYKLKSIEGLADLSRLQRLYVRDCHEIRELPGVKHCRSLKALDARDCPKLQWADGVLDQLRQHLETCLVGYYDDGH